jgi:photosystem II stability/assembly factor-like uncharacterized protein
MVVSDGALIAAAGQATLERSTDGGATWHLCSGPGLAAPRTNLAFPRQWMTLAVRGSEVVAVGDGGLALRSLDAGSTWTELATGTTADLTAVWIDDAGTLYLGGRGTRPSTTTTRHFSFARYPSERRVG